MMNALKNAMPRWSVLKAILGMVIILGTVVLVTLGYKSLGVLGLVPIIIGGILTKEYFKEIGFNS